MEKHLNELCRQYMNNPSIISIVLPVWNGEKYLNSAIESILTQSYKNFELIIVNDCSTDGSLDIALKFSEKDARVRVISNPENLKLPRSLNAGFNLANGAYYTWTSDDNLLHPNFLEKMLETLDATRADIVYGDFNSINEHGDLIGVSRVGTAEELVIANSIGASFLYKKEVHTSLAGFDAESFLYEDYDFWVRAYLSGFTFRKSNEILYDYRRHGESLTSTLVIPKKFAFYRYDLRKKFPKVTREIAFETRKSLMGYRLSLGKLRWFILLTESFFLNPKGTLNFVYQLVKKIPNKCITIFPKKE